MTHSTKMLAEDGDPATNFPTDGYLIGTRLNASRAVLLQSADSLNTHRSFIQHTADALWPRSIEAKHPIRKAFALLLTRPTGI